MKLQEQTKGQPQVVSHNHPTMRTFVTVGAVLFALTAMEFGIVYTEGMRSLVVAILFVLSAIKFVLVAGVFMHLKFDSKYLAWFFATGFVLATFMVIVLKFVNKA